MVGGASAGGTVARMGRHRLATELTVVGASAVSSGATADIELVSTGSTLEGCASAVAGVKSRVPGSVHAAEPAAHPELSRTDLRPRRGR